MKFDPAKIRYRFADCETIDNNWSQSGQDIFVLSMLNGLREGTYLEIGSCQGEELSNTCLLERKFGWRGAGVEINIEHVGEYNAIRTNKSMVADATTADFREVLRTLSGIEETTLDYLSCDCEPADQTFLALQNVIGQGFKFAVITFEHDTYNNDGSIKIQSREFLRGHGYVLVASNISALGSGYDYEDWWVHPDLVDADFIELFKNDNDTIKDWSNYIYPC
jgi:hypothetical protein